MRSKPPERLTTNRSRLKAVGQRNGRGSDLPQQRTGCVIPCSTGGQLLIRHPSSIFGAISGTTLAAGGATGVEQRGNLPAEDKIAEIHPGSTTKDEVIKILGSPSSVSVFNDKSWYYISRRTGQSLSSIPVWSTSRSMSSISTTKGWSRRSTTRAWRTVRKSLRLPGPPRRPAVSCPSSSS